MYNNDDSKIFFTLGLGALVVLMYVMFMNNMFDKDFMPGLGHIDYSDYNRF